MRLTIGITETEARYANYPLWMKADDPDIEVLPLHPENKHDLEKCDGIVLSGGIDMHPKWYNNQNLKYRLAPEVFNEQRDAFEIDIFKYAQKNHLPLLAICRGMQLVNSILGGDLIQDIEDSGKEDHRRHGETDTVHDITITKDSLLFEIIGSERGTVNSAHHQALGSIASDLKVNAYSPDGIVEGTEWKNQSGKPFLLCVQWHPERLAQQQPENPLANHIRKTFLKAVETNIHHTLK